MVNKIETVETLKTFRNTKFLFILKVGFGYEESKTEELLPLRVKQIGCGTCLISTKHSLS